VDFTYRGIQPIQLRMAQPTWVFRPKAESKGALSPSAPVAVAGRFQRRSTARWPGRGARGVASLGELNLSDGVGGDLPEVAGRGGTRSAGGSMAVGRRGGGGK
jgi:hypothetical protein